jgi:hypothetical protein
MDRRTFRDLKAHTRAEFVRRSFITINDIDYRENADMLVRCWNAIPGKNMHRAWNIT